MNSIRRQDGFTMVEVVIVIVIVGILSAIAIPNLLTYFPKSRLSGAARVVAGDLMGTRMQAVKLNRTAYLLYNGTQQYQIAYLGHILKSVDLSDDYEDVTFSSNFGSVQFNSRGAANASNTISLTNAGGTKQISVNIAGRVKIN